MYVQSAYIHHRKVFKNNLQPLLWGTYCIFITTTPYDKLSHISSMPKIVALDMITVLVDTETRFYTNWKFLVLGFFTLVLTRISSMRTVQIVCVVALLGLK